MWLPRWLGKRYSLLYEKFENRVFSFNEAESILAGNTAQILSELRRAGAICVFEKKKKRSYRVIEPDLFAFATATQTDVSQIKQGRYWVYLLELVKALKRRYKNRLMGVGVFGSVARGKARQDSDIDVLLIIENLPLSLGARIDDLAVIYVEGEGGGGWEYGDLKKEEQWLKSKGIVVKANFYPLTPEETAKTPPPVILDAALDLIPLYDPEDILKQYINRVKLRLLELKAKRVQVDKEGSYYLDLGLKYGEVVEIWPTQTKIWQKPT